MLRPADREQARALSLEFSLSPVLAQILLNRGLRDSQAVQDYLTPSLAQLPDPNSMKDMDVAVARLVRAIREQELITIYGDYDVDGTTATALLMEFFQEVGARVDYYIPHRVHEGYSLNGRALEELKARGTHVIVTVDNGISAVAEARQARDLGMDLIITDHHEVPPLLPQAYAILNPKRQQDDFPFKQLAGVGVAFYLLMGLRRALRESGLLSDREPNLRKALDLVAVGTIADMAPLVGLNRVLVREGLKELSKTERPGFLALLEVSGIEAPVRSDQVAFQLGPRINAVGRLEEASTGVRLLLEKDWVQAKSLAQRLDEANVNRRELEDQITQEAIARVEREALLERFQSIVLLGPDWHPGVVGIVASRLVEKYYRPTVVLTRERNMLKGSARSIRQFHLVDALRECAEDLDRFGGHAYAAGLSLKPENLEIFQRHFDQRVRSQLQAEDFCPALHLDVETPLTELDPAFMAQLEKLEPFGLGNPSPQLLVKQVEVKESRIVGEKHLKLRVGDGSRVWGAIGFRLADKQPPWNSRIDLAFTPEWNEWNGNKTIQLRVLDLQA